MAYLDFDVSDYIGELSTKELVAELERRTNGGDKDAVFEYRDWDRLADFIAEGRTREALDLLSGLSPLHFQPVTTLFYAHVRGH